MLRRQFSQALRASKTSSRPYSINSSGPDRSSKIGGIKLGLASVVVIGGFSYWFWPQGANNVNVKESGPAFTGQGFIDLKLDSVENVNHNTKKFRFLLPEQDQVSGLQTASCILTRYKGLEMEKAIIRPYTPTSDDDARGYLDLLVKKYPTGVMSSHFHNLSPGQSLEFKGPISKYPWSENKHEHVALIAGGTGIAPMYQIARAIFKNPADKTKVTLVFGNITEEDILLRKEWQELENTYPQRFRAYYMLDKPPKSWSGGKGFISKELLKTILPHPSEENIKVFVCGPPPMYKAICGMKKSASDQGEITGSILEQLGYSKDQIFKF